MFMHSYILACALVWMWCHILWSCFHLQVLLSEQSRLRSVNDIMPMIGARFYTQLDASQMRNDVIEEDLAKVFKFVYSFYPPYFSRKR